MRNIKNAWKVLSRLFVVLAFVIALENVVQFCYEDWSKYSLIIVSQRERKKLNGTLDTIYCGPSVTFNALDPFILDEKLGTSSFNLGASTQPLIGSYYLIRDVAENNAIRHVYQVLTIPMLKRGKKGRNYITPYKQMCTLRWRLSYLAALRDESRILPILAYSTSVKSYSKWSYVRKNIAGKTGENRKLAKYKGRGFRTSSNSVYSGEGAVERNPDYNYWDGTLGLEQANAEALQYLKKSAEFCNKNGIEYTILLLPNPQESLDSAGDLDNLNESLRGLADELGITFYNFQLYKNRLTEFANDKFRDDEHMNTPGGEAFSKLFAEVLSSEHPEEYFYESMSEFDSDQQIPEAG